MTITPPGRGPMRSASVRAANAELVLDHLRSGSARTRAELAEQTSLTSQALGPILAELVEAGLVIEESSQRPGPGRPPAQYSIDPTGEMGVSVIVRFADVTIHLIDAVGRVIASGQFRHRPGPTPTALMTKTFRLLHRMLDDEGLTLGRVGRLDLSVEGVVDQEQGIVVETPAWRRRDVDLRAVCESSLGRSDVEIVVNSNIRALALGALAAIGPDPIELVAVVSISHDTHLMLAKGTTLVSNRRGDTGSLAHLPLVGNARVCACGRTGCFGTVSSGRAVVENYHGLSGVTLDAAVDVIERIGRGEPDAIEAARQSIEWLGRGLSPILRLLSPDRVICTGAVGATGSRGAEALETTIRRHLDPEQADLTIDVVQPIFASQNLATLLIG